jgi:hypothetical protein
MTKIKELSLILLCILCASACSMEGGIDPNRQPDQSYDPVITPVDFPSVPALDNPYFPYAGERVWVFEGQTDEGATRVEVRHLPTAVTILGVECATVEEREWTADRLMEVSRNWFAQDKKGIVWYLGEDVDNFNTSGNLINHHGSWRAGEQDAKAGIMMDANPVPGTTYRQEYFFNNAEDQAEVVATNMIVTVPFGTFDNCIKIREWTELEPDVTEFKYYAPDIGLIKAENVSDGEELILIDIID